MILQFDYKNKMKIKFKSIRLHKDGIFASQRNQIDVQNDFFLILLTYKSVSFLRLLDDVFIFLLIYKSFCYTFVITIVKK